MSEKDNNIPGAPNDTPKNLHLGEDFEMWLKGRKEQKEYLVAKNHINTQSQLADLMETLGDKKSYNKISKTASETPKNSPSRSQESVAFTEQIYTRKPGDERKNVLHGIKESISAPLEVLVYGMVDLVKVLGNLKGESERTAAILRKESSAKII